MGQRIVECVLLIGTRSAHSIMASGFTTVTVLGGKGKYEGAKGDGTLTGARVVPLALGADLYNDIVINTKK